MDHQSNKPLAEISRKVRRDVIRMHQTGPGVASSMSAVDLMVGLYFGAMNFAHEDAKDPDRFILSKGHAAAALYATLAAKGVIDSSMLSDFLKDESPLTGHPARNSLPGIHTSTGSLGHGLPMAVGLAWAAKMDCTRSRIYVLQGDGELQEGSVWEAAALAARLELDNLVVIVDINDLQGYGRVNDFTPMPLIKDKWQAFGWQTLEIDGHDHEEISRAYVSCPLASEIPTAILARTVKGKGVTEMENQLGWHYFSVPEDKVAPFLQELR